MIKVAFIVGSPRSGTTVLGEILDTHPSIGNWYEPYFVIDRFFRGARDDVRTNNDATEKIKNYIRSEFQYFAKKQSVNIIIDKSPRNSFKIPFLLEIFPAAKFIHIIRDGRDACLSIHREWQKPKNILAKDKPFMRGKLFSQMAVMKRMISRQPLLKHKLQAVHFEMGSWLNFNFKSYLHRIRWNGQIGWGPLFKDRRSFLKEHSTLEFNAMQWVKAVETAQASLLKVPDEKKIEIRYENLLDFPEENIKNILDFLDEKPTRDFFDSIPKLYKANYNKWEKEFTAEEISKIKPILNPLLIKLGYVKDKKW